MAIALSPISDKVESHYRLHVSQVTKVQACVRGWLLRRSIEPEKKLLNRITSLNEKDLQKYELMLDVFCFDTVVMKKREDCHKDFLAHELAKNLCLKEGLDRLAIPACRVYKNRIIENRLPISPDFKEQIGTYIEHHALFDTAVKQFIIFLLRTKLHDIVGGTAHPYQCFTNIEIPRYDNVCFYIENGAGRIALIDLEKFELCEDWFNRDLDGALTQLVTLFPYHLDLIIKEFKIAFPEFEISAEYNNLQKQMFAYFNKVYFDHKSFLLAKFVTPQEAKKGQIDLSKLEIEDIAKKTRKDKEKVETIAHLLNARISKKNNCKSWEELLAYRSPEFKFEDMDVPILKELRERNHIQAYTSFSCLVVHL